jgi:hypothetical protein
MLLAKFLLVQFIYFGLWIQGSFNGWRYDIALWAFIWSWWNAACYQNGQFSIEGIFGLWNHSLQLSIIGGLNNFSYWENTRSKSVREKRGGGGFEFR